MTSGRPTIRDARDDEREAIRALTLRAYSEYAHLMTPSAWAGLERALHAAFSSDVPVERIVAERDGRIVGSVSLYPPAVDAYAGEAKRVSWPEIRMLAVEPEARGQGISRLLVDACIRRARELGATAIGLHTSRSMRAAIALYEGLGFVRVPEYDFQPEGAELVTAYRLDLA